MTRRDRLVWGALACLAAALALGVLRPWARATAGAVEVDARRRAPVLQTPEPAPAAERAVSTPAREEVVAAPEARTLALELVRFPDEAPLDGVPVEIEPGAEAPEDLVLTSAAGRVEVVVPGGV